MVWFKEMIPRHSFISWLVVLNRLSTRDRQVKHNPLINPKRMFCDMAESRDHLYFKCSYTSVVWLGVISKVGKAGLIPTDWPMIVEWVACALNRNARINILSKIALQASLYNLWIERNSRIYTQASKNTEDLISLITQVVRYRIFSLPKIKAVYPSS